MSTLMAVHPNIPASGPGWVPSRRFRMTVDENEAMVASGAFKGRHRFHLIDGYLVEKMTQDPPHRVADELCGVELARVLPAGRDHVAAAKPVRITGRDSEPEPDHCVVRATRDDEGHHPGPGGIALIVEFADSSLADDRRLAAEVYGPAGIPAHWIVDLVHRQVEVYTGPGPWGYRSRAVVPEGQSVPVVNDGQALGAIAVADILPSRPATAGPG